MGVTIPPEALPPGTSSTSPHRFSLDRIGDVLRNREPRTVAGTTHAAAVALVLRQSDSGLDALFIRRAEHPDDPWSGHIGLPGGRAESRDQGLVHTAIRETEEEIGLSLATDRDLLGALDETRAVARAKSIDLKIAPFVFAAPEAPDQLILSGEVAAAHWVPLLALFDAAHTASVTMRHGGQDLRFPAIEVHGLTIWGLTLRMLRNFETLVSRS
jgi:8-oxo-dGTP pyrophosphatase MutT (NUDIX family)